MRYLGNDTNEVRDAVLTATNGVASDAIYRTDTAPKNGGGLVELTGPYTGAADCTIDVEVVDNGGSTTQTSQPVFIGVGNGTMSDVEVVDVDPATITVTLEDLGTETRKAYVPFQGITLRAAVAGDSGNDIAIDIDHSGLILGATDWSLREAMQQGTNEYIGDHWNFGGLPLEPDGSIPADAPRLTFGTDPQEYRQYKKFVLGRYVYSFEPSPVRDVLPNTRVHTISGTRSITISNGTTTESFGDEAHPIVTLYDALTAIRDNSTLVVVDAPIVNDRKPGGQGITPLSVHTRSYVLGVFPNAQGPIAHAELAITADATAPTETLTITCKEAVSVGNEKWEVRGDVSQQLADAITGVLYANGHYEMTIPPPAVLPGSTPGGTMLVELIANVRGEGATMPSLCVEQPRLGINARDGIYEFVYTRRPATDCDCTEGDLEGGPNDDCLGTVPEVGDMTDASIVRRLQQLTAKVREYVGSNTPDVPSLAYSTDGGDVNMVLTTADILKQALGKLSAGKLTYPVWQASHAYSADTMVETTTRNGYRYAATTAGTSGASEPSWTTTVGDTISDGTVEWTNMGKLALGAWDDLLTQWSGEMSALTGIGTSTALAYDLWTATTAITGGVRPTTPNGHLYRLFATTGAGETGATEPTWPTDGSTVVDGDLTWIDSGAYWTASQTLAKGARMLPGTGVLMMVYSPGTTGTTEPEWPGPDAVPDSPSIPLQITDGSLTWAAYPLGSVGQTGTYAPDVEYYDRWKTAAGDVLAAAEITPNFEVAGTNGDGCWHDFHDWDYWFVYDGTQGAPYLPIQVGHYYHASKLGMDENGQPYSRSTLEFGFGPRFGCPENLIEGDRIRVTIEGAGGGGSSGYSVGDAFQVLVNQASPLPLGGGQTGDDTLTWSVVIDDGTTQTRLDDYTLITTAVAPYSGAAGSGTVGFQIDPGGIAFGLGDKFVFSIEGGRFKWRQNGGSWSSPVDIADTLLVDGLTVNFTGGAAPSWVAGDRWSFAAEATYGVDNLRTPVDGEFEWTGSTTITVTPNDGGIVGIAIMNHQIPSDATITLQGSDDDFSTTPLSQAIQWRAGDIWLAVTADRAKYRLQIDRGGSIRWLYLGESTQPEMVKGGIERGTVTKRRRPPGVGQRAGMSADVEHTALSQDGVDALLAMVDHACSNDDRLIAFVPNDARQEVFSVRVPADPIDITDELGYQPDDIGDSLQACTIRLEAAA